MLLILQLVKLRFVGVDQGSAVGLDDSRDALVDLALDALQLPRNLACSFLRRPFADFPLQLQHGMRREQQVLRGADAIEQAVKIGLKLFLADVFAREFAPLG
ncbi:MAG: hypothetical protein WC807_02950 [Hyphomicrobium sp.]